MKEDGNHEEGKLDEENAQDKWRKRGDGERKRMRVNGREMKVQLVEKGKGWKAISYVRR